MKKKLTKKSKRILNKLLGLSLCPHCECDFVEDEEIGFSQSGTQTSKVWLDGDYLGYEADDFEQSGETEFYCRSCGGSLELNEEEVIKILKSKL